MNFLKLAQNFGYNISKKLFLPKDMLNIGGIFDCEHRRYSIFKSGKIKGFETLNRFSFHNGITNVGKNYLLNTAFVSGTQILTSAWCMSLIDNTGFSALSASDTMGSHGGWSEFIGITETTRVAWGPATSTAQLLTNPSLCVFDIAVTGTVYGAFITSDNTLSGTAGTLWTTGAFPAPVSVTGGTDQLRLTYNLAC